MGVYKKSPIFHMSNQRAKNDQPVTVQRNETKFDHLKVFILGVSWILVSINIRASITDETVPFMESAFGTDPSRYWTSTMQSQINQTSAEGTVWGWNDQRCWRAADTSRSTKAVTLSLSTEFVKYHVQIAEQFRWNYIYDKLTENEEKSIWRRVGQN